MDSEKPAFKLTLCHKILIVVITIAFIALHASYLETNNKDDMISNFDVLEFNKTEIAPVQSNPFQRGQKCLKLSRDLRKISQVITQ